MVPETANTVRCDKRTSSYQPPSCQPKTCGSAAEVSNPANSEGCKNIPVDGVSPDALYYQDERAACTVTCKTGFSTTGIYESVKGTRDKYQQAYTCKANEAFTPQPIPMDCKREISSCFSTLVVRNF